MLPQTQFLFKGKMMPNAPDDMIAALGKNGQFINVIPSQKMVWIRMGEAPDNSQVPFTFNDDIWAYLNRLKCTQTPIDLTEEKGKVSVYPNPVKDELFINQPASVSFLRFEIKTITGQIVLKGKCGNKLNLSDLKPGIYYLWIYDEINSETIKLLKK
jgi:hypothetical protein